METLYEGNYEKSWGLITDAHLKQLYLFYFFQKVLFKIWSTPLMEQILV